MDLNTMGKAYVNATQLRKKKLVSIYVVLFTISIKLGAIGIK